MTSARTSLGEVRTRRRSRRAAGPSASARRAASSQHTGGASVSAAWPPGELPDQPLDRVPAELRELAEEQDTAVREGS
jgi:hypothetical protein